VDSSTVGSEWSSPGEQFTQEENMPNQWKRKFVLWAKTSDEGWVFFRCVYVREVYEHVPGFPSGSRDFVYQVRPD
jgi:hypothetical protein